MIKVIIENLCPFPISENLIKAYQTDFKTRKPILNIGKVAHTIYPSQPDQELEVVELPDDHIFANCSKIIYFLNKEGHQRRKLVFRKNWKSPLEKEKKFPITKFVNKTRMGLGLQDEFNFGGIVCPPDTMVEKHLHVCSEWAKYSKVWIDMCERVRGPKWDEKKVLEVAVKKTKLRPKAELERLKKLCEEEVKIRAEIEKNQRPLLVTSNR